MENRGLEINIDIRDKIWDSIWTKILIRSLNFYFKEKYVAYENILEKLHKLTKDKVGFKIKRGIDK